MNRRSWKWHDNSDFPASSPWLKLPSHDKSAIAGYSAPARLSLQQGATTERTTGACQKNWPFPQRGHIWPPLPSPLEELTQKVSRALLQRLLSRSECCLLKMRPFKQLLAANKPGNSACAKEFYLFFPGSLPFFDLFFLFQKNKIPRPFGSRASLLVALTFRHAPEPIYCRLASHLLGLSSSLWLRCVPDLWHQSAHRKQSLWVR